MFKTEELNSIDYLSVHLQNEPIYQYHSGYDGLKDIRSITKSVISLLVGMALQENWIDSLERSVGYYLQGGPEDITIEDLLCMRSGYLIDDSQLNELLTTSDNWVKDIMKLDRVREKVFQYKGVDFHLLSAVLSEVTGKNAAHFAGEHLFPPLGIEEYTWQTDPQGINIGSTGLCLSGESLNKMARLILNNGEHNGEQVLPFWWFMGMDYHHTGLPYGCYKYGFWRKKLEQFEVIRALGTGGQQILVSPESQLTIVLTADPTIHSHAKTEEMTLQILDKIPKKTW